MKVTPGAQPGYRRDGSGSHYYLARRTDAAPLQSGTEKEKFLFYRGLGNFEPPISATPGADGSVVVRNPDGEAVGDVVMFVNRGGTIAYESARRKRGWHTSPKLCEATKARKM